MKYITLNNGVRLPSLGFGTWCIDNAKAAEAVRTATELGYRHIDTAQAYGNERGVGEGVRTCGVPRAELFVVSKVAAENKSYETAARSIDETLEKMGLDYLDMMIIHSPQPWAEWRGENRYFAENREVWRALEDACGAGKLRAIGVSNFLEDDLDSLLPHCKIKPAVDQVLAHIGNTPKKLIAYCADRGIAVEAYSPIAHGEAMKSGAIADVAAKYGVTPAQLCIKYILELGLAALPKASTVSIHSSKTAAVFKQFHKLFVIGRILYLQLCQTLLDPLEFVLYGTAVFRIQKFNILYLPNPAPGQTGAPTARFKNSDADSSGCFKQNSFYDFAFRMKCSVRHSADYLTVRRNIGIRSALAGPNTSVSVINTVPKEFRP